MENEKHDEACLKLLQILGDEKVDAGKSIQILREGLYFIFNKYQIEENYRNKVSDLIKLLLEEQEFIFYYIEKILILRKNINIS